jgi:hypothetical protein
MITLTDFFHSAVFYGHDWSYPFARESNSPVFETVTAAGP